MKTSLFPFVFSFIFVLSCTTTEKPTKEMIMNAPKAEKIPTTLKKHDDLRVDNYFWLNDRENPEVIDYLERENDYNDKVTAHTQAFQKSLFEEMKSRIKEDDESVPYFFNGYWYITRYEEGKQYPVYTRKKESMEADEEILFDCNELAKGYSYYRLSGIEISPDNKLAAFAVDTVSRRQHTIQIKNLETGQIYPERIENTTGSSSFANDNTTLFYTQKNPQTLRSERIFKHKLGTAVSEDEMIFHEADDTFSTYVYMTKSQQYLIIGSSSTLTSEYQYLDANTPDKPFTMFQERERGIEYGISHFEDHFYVVTNADNATNFKLMKTPVTNTSRSNWEEVIPHREDVLLEGIDIFKDYLVVSERTNGLNQINIQRWDGAANYYLPFESETYTAYTTTNIAFDTQTLRYAYNSMTTPSSVIDFDMETKEKEVKKEQQVLGGKFDKSNYVSERVWAPATDGTMIPISMVYRKDIGKSKSNPLLLYGYGSYGNTIDPYFSSVRLSLLDRGFIFAIAHIRGGQYLGRQWYEDGKLLNKKNTFTDFIDCSRFLIDQKYTSPEHHYAMGGSAGGLLMGAVINMAPELYNGVVSAVPFVDVVSTMLDDSIPLTTGEYDEWGNPNEEKYYHYMKSYSPYDNVTAQEYPNMLVTTGLHDSQVQYWEPAKWVAKLRELKTDSNILLLHTNMDAGHGGSSGRFEALKEIAEEYAFLMDLEGIHE